MTLINEEILLVYDKECPACNAYCQIVQINETVGQLRLVDARESTEVLAEITAMNLDIDQGMVLKMNQQIYYGADAINMLALVSSRFGVFNRINYYLFKTPLVAKMLYPVLRCFRGVLLKILQKTKINNLDMANNEKF